MKAKLCSKAVFVSNRLSAVKRVFSLPLKMPGYLDSLVQPSLASFAFHFQRAQKSKCNLKNNSHFEFFILLIGKK